MKVKRIVLIMFIGIILSGCARMERWSRERNRNNVYYCRMCNLYFRFEGLAGGYYGRDYSDYSDLNINENLADVSTEAVENYVNKVAQQEKPEVATTTPIEAQETTGPKCPRCGRDMILKFPVGEEVIRVSFINDYVPWCGTPFIGEPWYKKKHKH